jgi:hypothetical protein
VLSLWNTQVSDAGLKHLKGLSRLRYLNLNGTLVTEEGIADLRRAIPGLTVVR